MQVVIKMINNHIVCKSDSFKNEQAEFLLDTGSNVNLIQIQCLKDDVKLIPGENIYLKGINNTLVETIGIVEIQLNIEKSQIGKVKFYIVKDNVPLIKSGIMGQPFLKEHEAFINMADETITINQVEKYIKIPPRVEYIAAIKIDDSDFKNDDFILINNAEINEQVYVGNVVSKIKNNEILVKLINLSEEEKQINSLKLTDLKYEIFNETNVCNITNTDIIKKRNKRIGTI